MAIIPKILQKINPSYQNYQPLIEHDIPVLFTINKDTDTFIDFVNVYRPGRGQLAITLSKTTKDTIQNLVQTNGKLNPLFLNSVHYSYNKGVITKTPLNNITRDNYTPHKDIRFNDFPNKITLLAP